MAIFFGSGTIVVDSGLVEDPSEDHSRLVGMSFRTHQRTPSSLGVFLRFTAFSVSLISWFSPTWKFGCCGLVGQNVPRSTSTPPPTSQKGHCGLAGFVARGMLDRHNSLVSLPLSWQSIFLPIGFLGLSASWLPCIVLSPPPFFFLNFFRRMYFFIVSQELWLRAASKLVLSKLSWSWWEQV